MIRFKQKRDLGSLHRGIYFACVCIFSIQSVASEPHGKDASQLNPRVIKLELASNEVFSAEDEIILSDHQSGFILQETARVTVTAGTSIRMLPGTHIKAGAELVAAIVSVEQQWQLAKKAQEAENKHAIASIMNRSAHEANDVIDAEYYLRDFNHTGHRAIIRQMVSFGAVLPSRKLSFFGKWLHSATASITHQHIIHHFFGTLASRPNPSIAWGDRAETIAVMRT